MNKLKFLPITIFSFAATTFGYIGCFYKGEYHDNFIFATVWSMVLLLISAIATFGGGL